MLSLCRCSNILISHLRFQFVEFYLSLIEEVGGRELKANPVKEWATQKGFEVRSPARPDQAEIDWIKERAADIYW